VRCKSARGLATLCLLWVAGTCQYAAAHSLSPSLLELVEADGTEYAMRIKQPLKRAQVEPVEALFPVECEAVSRWEERRSLESPAVALASRGNA